MWLHKSNPHHICESMMTPNEGKQSQGLNSCSINSFIASISAMSFYVDQVIPLGPINGDGKWSCCADGTIVTELESPRMTVKMHAVTTQTALLLLLPSLVLRLFDALMSHFSNPMKNTGRWCWDRLGAILNICKLYIHFDGCSTHLYVATYSFPHPQTACILFFNSLIRPVIVSSL